jgi:Right handed beta helix region/Inverse autotransporter, beta-domain
MRRLLPLLLTCMQLSALWSPDNSWQPYLEVEGQFGNYRKGAGLLSWTPLLQDQRQVGFMQVRLGNFRDVWDGSIGFGYRSLIRSNLGFGVNLFGDFARSPERTHYLQGGLGAELFGNCWLVRTNGYLADSRLREDFRRTSFVFIEELEIFSRDRDVLTRTQGYSGFDIEGGAGFDLCWGELWGYLTYFHFTGRQVPAIQGPRARLEWFWNNAASIGGSRVTLAAEWDYTRRHGNTVSGYASVRFPLGTCNPSRGICRLMSDPVIRERSIWVDDNVRVTNPLVDLNQKIFFVEEREDVAAGTQLDPTNLTDAVNSAGPNDIIFLLGDEGTITAIPITLQNGQQLYGFDNSQSVNITVAGGRTLTVDNITGGPIPPLLDGTTLVTSVITLANNNTIFGMTIEGGSSEVISGSGVSNGTIQQVSMTNIGTFGISLDNADNMLIDSVDITNVVSSAGMTVINSSNNIDIRNLTISGDSEDSFTAFDSGNISISGATIQGMTQDQMLLVNLTGKVTLASVTLTQETGNGITIDGGSATFLALDSTLDVDMGGRALHIFDMSGNVNWAGLSVTATNTLDNPILVEDNTGSVTLGPLDLSDLTSQIAVDVKNNSGAVTLTSLSATNISGAGSRALLVQNQSGEFTATASDLETTSGNPVLELDNVSDADVVVTNLTATTPASGGVVIKDTSGGITIANGTITSAPGIAFEVDGGSPSISYTGAITNTAGGFIDIQNTTGGSLIFTGSSPGALSADMGDGLVMKNGASNLTLTNAEIKNITGTGAIFESITGDILIADSTFDSHTIFGIGAMDVASLTLQGTTLQNVGTSLLFLENNDMDGNLTVEKNCLFSTAQDGIGVFNVGSGNMVITCIDSTFVDLKPNPKGRAILAVQEGEGGSLSAAIGRCSFDDVIVGMQIGTAISATDCSFAYNVSDNEFGTTTPVGVALVTEFFSAAAGNVTVNGLFSNNGTVKSTAGGVAIETGLLAASDEATLSVENNNFTSTADISAVTVQITKTGVQNISILDNQQTVAAGAAPGYEITTVDTPTVCATILDNNSNQTTGINLDNGGGILSVTDALNLPALNNGITCSTTGTITDLGALLCPTPTVPPIPSGS